MAGNIKGITIEFRGETTKLQKAIKTVNTDLSKTQKDLTAVNNALKFNPSNVELLTQKQRLLSKEIEETTEKLQLLDKRQDALDASGVDKSSKEYMDLRREIIETESKLKTFEGQQKELGNVKLTAFKNELKAIKEQTEETRQAIGKVSEGLSSAGQTLTQKVTLPLMALFGGSIKYGIDWESAFVGVMKTVDETATTTYADIEEGIKGIARTTASSKTDIAGVAEVAGQLGISADDVVDFTRTMVMLGDTTNLSAEDAAVALARILNITGDTSDQVDELGSVIVALGNNFATTESEITEMANRLAASGKLAGLTTPEIFALAASMSSVGIQAEAGGTAMTQTLTALESEVANFRAGAESNLDRIAEISGISAEDFATAWETNPIEAIQGFITGLGELDEKGESATLVLDELGMSGVRQGNMLKSLALASDELSGALDVANGSFSENTALTVEAEKRYNTTAAQINQTKEKLLEVALTLAEKLMPYVDMALEAIDQAIAWFQELDPEMQDMIIKGLLLAAAIGPLVSALGALGSAIDVLDSPIGIALIAIGEFIYKIWRAKESIETWMQKIKEFKEYVGPKFEEIKNKIVGPLETAREKVRGIIEKIKGYFPFNLGKILNLKLPHITLSGGSPPWGIAGRGSLPHFNVDWYAKGGIFKSPSIIGVGEAGSEAVVPLDKFWDKIDGIGKTVNINVSVNGADNPEEWARRLVKQMRLEMRSI